VIKNGGKLGLMGNKSTTYAWPCLFNCAAYAYDVLHNVFGLTSLWSHYGIYFWY